MKHMMRNFLLVICSSVVIGIEATPTPDVRATHKEANDIVRRIKNLTTRSGTSVDATNVILEAILACLYEIKFDLLAAIMPKLCNVASQLDGVEFTIVDAVDNAGQSLGFTVCDKMSDIDTSLGFTICEKLENAMYSLNFTIADSVDDVLASLGFTVCDKLPDLESGLQFTIVDQVGDATASLGFTVCDKLATPVINIPALGFTVCDTVENTQASLGFTVCDKTEVIAEDTASALEKVCSALDIILSTTQDPDFDSLRFTICEKAETIVSKLDGILCPVTMLTAADFGGGDTLTLSTAGINYCLGEDISLGGAEKLILITADDVSLDMNDRKFVGRIQIQGDRVEVKNGKICPPAPTAAPAAAVTFAAINVEKSSLTNCIIQCADSQEDMGNDGVIGSGFVGRIGVLVGTGNREIRIADCCIQAGDSVSTTAGGFRSGGDGIRINGIKTRVVNCDIQAGNGETISAGTGASGGHGIQVSSSAVGTCIFDCKIAAGDSPDVTTSTGPGGHGILVNNAEDTVIRRCFITKAGEGGTAFSSGSGGDGILISASSINTEVRNCTIACTGAAGSMGAFPGRAIDDLVAITTSIAGGSVIADNFAFKIADTLVRYNIHGTGAESGIDITTTVPENGDNVFVP